MKKQVAISVIILFLCLTILSGCGALLSVIIQAVLGTKLGFIAIPAIAAAKITESEVDKKPGMILLPHNNPPEGYEMAEGATVSIEGYAGTVITGSDGFFRFDEVPVGIKDLTVEHPNFISIQQEVVVTEDGSENRPFTGFKIVPDGPVTLSLLKDVIEVPQADAYFETYGLDPNDVEIRPSATWTVSPSKNAEIDPNGAFRATDTGVYKVTATSVLDPSVSDTVNITVVEYTMIVQGTVTDTAGQPVSGASITVEETNLLTKTDENGSYILEGVPATSVITVSAEYLSLTGSSSKTVDDFNNPVTVNIKVSSSSTDPFASPTVSAGTGSLEGITYGAGGTVKGSSFLAFYSVANLSGSLNAQASPDRTTVSDGNGYYFFTDVPAGDCRIEFWDSEADYNSQPQNPLGAVNETVVKDTVKIINITEGDLRTPVPTPTPTVQWRKITGPVVEDLMGIDFIDVNNGWAVGDNGTFLYYDGSSWSDTSPTIISPPPSAALTDNLVSIDFLDSSTGFVGDRDDGSAYKTTDGGITWTRVISISGSSTIQDIFFIDGNHGWTSGKNDLGQAEIHVTTNGGGALGDWSPNGEPTYEVFSGVHFVDTLNGWTCGFNGTSGVILFSINGGTSWNEIAPQGLSSAPFRFTCIYFTDSGHGWAAGEGGNVYYYNDTGWNPASSTGTTAALKDIYFLDSSTGWAVGEGGVIIYTSDGGINWSTVTSPTTADLESVYFTDYNNGWAIGSGGTILHYSP